MSTAASQRQAPRRRLLPAWNRSRPAATASESRRPSTYSPEALPEHQPSFASLLPVSFGGFAAAAAGLLVAFAATTAVGLWEALADRPLVEAGATRFSATLVSARRCVDIHSLESLAGWLAHLCLAGAAVTALTIGQMRRHRRDEHRGHSLAWNGLAGLFVLTDCAGQVPLGSLFASLINDATGITLGPSGIGWWVLAAGTVYTAMGLWAWLPLYERATAGLWLTASLAAWAAAAACRWLGPDLEILPRGLNGAAGNLCWMAGGVLAAISMLAAARSVLREVRGFPTSAAAARTASRSQTLQATNAAARGPATAVTAWAHAGDSHDAHDDEADREDDRSGQGQTVFVDGGDAADEDDPERSGRPLSKAEKKRLRKLARMSRAA